MSNGSKEQQTLRIDCGEAAKAVLQGSASDFFHLVQLAWNLREIVRLLTPGNSEAQFHEGIDPLWIKESNKSYDEVFKRLGLSLKDARRLFAPENCTDLVVPHVAFETEVTPGMEKVSRKYPVQRDAVSQQDTEETILRKYSDCNWLYCPTCSGVKDVVDANRNRVPKKLWPYIFKMHQMANDVGCIC